MGIRTRVGENPTLHIRNIMTPVMKHAKDVWLENNVRRCMDNDCTIPTTAENLGISQETAAKWYNKIMIADSKRAIHELYGKVRVYQWKKSGHYFIFHPTEDRVIGKENPDFDDWKCPPVD